LALLQALPWVSPALHLLVSLVPNKIMKVHRLCAPLHQNEVQACLWISSARPIPEAHMVPKAAQLPYLSEGEPAYVEACLKRSHV